MSSKRSFTPQPQQKSADYHGSCRVGEIHKRKGDGLNVFLTFEEACKLQVALQSTLLALNRHNRNTEIGRSLGVGIWLDTPNSALKVYEQKKSAHRKETDAEQNGDS